MKGVLETLIKTNKTASEQAFVVSFLAYIFAAQRHLSLKKCLQAAIFNTLKSSREGKFVGQLQLLQNLLQEKGKKQLAFAQKKISDPLLKEFLLAAQKKIYRKKTKVKKEMASVLEFVLQIEKLQKMERLYWRLRNVKNPETVAGHIYSLTLAVLLLGENQRGLSLEKLLKMSLCHELSAVYTGDTTPYDRFLHENGAKEREEILKRMIRLSKKEKEGIFIEDYKQEKRSIEKLVRRLPAVLKKEIMKLWQEYRTKGSQEARFLAQLNVAVILLQGLIYEKRQKNFSAAPLWELSYEVADHPLILEFLDAVKQKFYS